MFHLRNCSEAILEKSNESVGNLKSQSLEFGNLTNNR